MKEGKAASLEEALQRILFINSIQWQTGHILVGLGRLDQVLDDFASDSRPDSEILDVLKEFLQRLHDSYCLKSNALMGDTGQIIILAGNNEDDSYFCNRFTYLFPDAVREINLPDPKALVRVSSKTPSDLWDKLINLVSEDCGSPLISNDDEVIPKMAEFGYSKASSCGYTTSACWEPMPSECCEQNNIVSINYLEPFEYISKSGREISDFVTFMKLYYEGLKAHIDSVIGYIDSIEWEKDPVLSLYNSSSRKKGIDVAYGGGEYNNYGLLTVGMANAVKSIRNIRHLVFEKKDNRSIA
ncbi:MAG: pyruvate formate lyase family protein, partial [Lachnospiraceae bacterium]|nr:pyruvate formate lyase family protein [Lachnospiraceae bacterium]